MEKIMRKQRFVVSWSVLFLGLSILLVPQASAADKDLSGKNRVRVQGVGPADHKIVGPSDIKGDMSHKAGAIAPIDHKILGPSDIKGDLSHKAGVVAPIDHKILGPGGPLGGYRAAPGLIEGKAQGITGDNIKGKAESAQAKAVH